jgi:hypothetical protein
MLKREIVVVNNDADMQTDLIQDFIAIITSFCARIYGVRIAKLRNLFLNLRGQNKCQLSQPTFTPTLCSTIATQAL